MATLADVIKQRRSTGQSRTGSLIGSLKDKLKEKIDPRQLFNQSGILTALFPSLKAFKAKGISGDVGKLLQKKTLDVQDTEQLQSLNSLSTIEQNTKIAAINSLSLPSLSRDVNVMRQNISKLVKVVGLKPETKADNFFKKNKERETEYETKFNSKKVLTVKSDTVSTNDEKEKSKGFLSKLMAIVGGLIKAVINTITSIIETLYSTIKGLITGVIHALKLAIVSVITSIPKFLKTVFKKLLGTFTKVFSLLGSGGLLQIIKGLLFSKAGAVLLAGVLAAHLIKMAFIRDEDRRNLFQDLDKLVKSGDASPEQTQLHRELYAKGYRSKEEELGKPLTDPAGITEEGRKQNRTPSQNIASITEIVNQKPGDQNYMDDDYLKKLYGYGRDVLKEFVKGGSRETLDQVNERMTNKDLQPLPEETTSPVPINPETNEPQTNSPLSQIELNQILNYQSIQDARKNASTMSNRAQSDFSLFKKTGSEITNATEVYRESVRQPPEIDITNIETPDETLSPINGGNMRSKLPDVINRYYPEFSSNYG